MLGGKYAYTHHSRYYGNAVFLREFTKLLYGIAEVDSSARTYKRFTGFLKLFDHLLDLKSVSLDGRLVSTKLNLLGIFEIPDLSLLNINGEIYKYRSASA